MNLQAETIAGSEEERFQDAMLVGVSRTFALTIPQLPRAVRLAVTNAYLLCRIADTIEDDPGVGAEEKEVFHMWLVELLSGRDDAAAFAQKLSRKLTPESSPDERHLVQRTGRVIKMFRRLDDASRAILSRRVAVMCRGMPVFQRCPRRDGLHNLTAMDQYCYYVAGVVGQMLTELFCNHSKRIADVREDLFALSASFGQGLQMTNILKDIWEDLDRDACWLPRDVFEAHGYDLSNLHPDGDRRAFTAGLRDLIGVAHGHLRNALSYTLLIPARETGIRRFCLWSLVLAVLTLRRIHGNPYFNAGSQVKVPRHVVERTVRLTSAACMSNIAVRALFAWMAQGLPLTRKVSTYQEFERAVSPQ